MASAGRLVGDSCNVPKQTLGSLTVCLLGFIQWESFNHTIYPLQLAELNGLFGIQGMAAWPGVYRQSSWNLHIN